MRAATVFAGLLSVASAVNGLSFSAAELFEKLRAVPENWIQVGSPDAAQKLRFMIAVKQVRETNFHIHLPGAQGICRATSAGCVNRQAELRQFHVTSLTLATLHSRDTR